MKFETTERFVKEAKGVHNNFYSYEDSIYIKIHSKLTITCPIHGNFIQQASKHLRGQGCSECAREKRISKKTISKDEIIARAVEIHGGKYDYSPTLDYKNLTTKLNIICPYHGLFTQIASVHLSGCGCPLCGFNWKTLENFILKSREVHGDKYDYSEVNYISSLIPVKIICPTHGMFEQVPVSHSRGSGCCDCGHEKTTSATARSFEDFLLQSQENHGDRYDYSLVSWKSFKREISIICPDHGVFIQRAGYHAQGKACPDCQVGKVSIGEFKIHNFLKAKDIKFESQKVFDNCRNPLTSYPLRFDFYLPNENIAIEYDGVQHFKPVEHWGGQGELKDTKFRDEIKNKYCIDNNINLVRISYLDNVEGMLNLHVVCRF